MEPLNDSCQKSVMEEMAYCRYWHAVAGHAMKLAVISLLISIAGSAVPAGSSSIMENAGKLYNALPNSTDV